MVYLAVFFLMLLVMLIYFRIANYFNIIDKPNNRSSHTEITIRGAGVIFYVAALLYFFWSDFQYPYFFIGLSLIALVSFLDDLFTLSNKVRTLVHFTASIFLLYQADLFSWPWYVLPIVTVTIMGIINAYNFMDGINGITTAYSFSVLILLWLTNREYNFIDSQFLFFVSVGNLVFAIFNFRNKAKCFAGDVGSVVMSFIIIFSLICLILCTENFMYMLFLAVYGTDSVLTIVHRLIKKEDVFEAHRSHLYQYLSNEVNCNRLFVASSYAFLQIIIGVLTIKMTDFSSKIQLLYSISVLLFLSIIYITLKSFILKSYIRN